MLVVSAHPDIGVWYKSPEIEEIFEVIDVDADNDCVDIQYFNGDIGELDIESWRNMQIIEVAEPEDWSGAYKMSQEDLANYLDDTIRPEKHQNPLAEIDRIAD